MLRKQTFMILAPFALFTSLISFSISASAAECSANIPTFFQLNKKPVVLDETINTVAEASRLEFEAMTKVEVHNLQQCIELGRAALEQDKIHVAGYSNAYGAMDEFEKTSSLEITFTDLSKNEKWIVTLEKPTQGLDIQAFVKSLLNPTRTEQASTGRVERATDLHSTLTVPQAPTEPTINTEVVETTEPNTTFEEITPTEVTTPTETNEATQTEIAP